MNSKAGFVPESGKYSNTRNDKYSWHTNVSINCINSVGLKYDLVVRDLSKDRIEIYRSGTPIESDEISTGFNFFCPEISKDGEKNMYKLSIIIKNGNVVEDEYDMIYGYCEE